MAYIEPVIVFLTVYLGLIAGRRPFEVRADPAVHAIRFLLDGREVAALQQPPWKASVDLGDAVEPHEIVAVGFGDNGKEIARASQIVNLPRPAAEVDVILDRESVTLQPRHISYAKVKSAKVTLDGKALDLDRRLKAALPEVDRTRPHVVTAEVEFADGTVARREVVFGGAFSDSVPAELTPAAITPAAAEGKPVPDDCFAPLRLNSVEKGGALLVIVRDPLPPEIANAPRGRAAMTPAARRSLMTSAMAAGAMELMSSVAEPVQASNQPTALMFPHLASPDPRIGLYWFVTMTRLPAPMKEPRQWADAVAVAGVHAASSGKRRAVILLLGRETDTSRSAPAAVRRYLDRIGVPLFVWSASGPRPDVAGEWGEVVDVSSRDKLEQATAQVNGVLESQRIAWLYADPIAAIHARATSGCGWRTLARN